MRNTPTNNSAVHQQQQCGRQLPWQLRRQQRQLARPPHPDIQLNIKDPISIVHHQSHSIAIQSASCCQIPSFLGASTPCNLPSAACRRSFPSAQCKDTMAAKSIAILLLITLLCGQAFALPGTTCSKSRLLPLRNTDGIPSAHLQQRCAFGLRSISSSSLSIASVKVFGQ